ncbi:hypothetical protein PR202_ga24318 [Eleusine coracana subsp. coracana]|uniref:aminodeoxychorismate lyase n=1 Tax=Eleusine coracana subsp. coracana TaxID=191504 RepID=A0AAV5D836_ELECO|nr:hypothetical protein PR202_ga24318 [Eleusine coracana subsp. coracana]
MQVLQKLQEKCCSNRSYPAMYSSIVGGIILDPAMMVIPMDDHMVHRGHGVFDTAMIMDGWLYELDAHLDRFLRSAANARIIHPPVLSNNSSSSSSSSNSIREKDKEKEKLRSILVQMTAASGCRKGSIRYWLSSGPGDFLLSSSGCSPSPAFYAVVIASDYEQCRDEGVKAVTTAVPMKPPLFATTKNVNYLPNVLSIMDAEDRGAFASVWVDEQGFVAEGPMVNVAFVTPQRELVLPVFDNILAGCTAKRMLALATNNNIILSVPGGVSNRKITADEARGCVEMAFVGSGLPVLPVVEWDGQPVGDGKVGPVMRALSDLLWEDMKSGPDRIPVPYYI